MGRASACTLMGRSLTAPGRQGSGECLCSEVWVEEAGQSGRGAPVV